MIKKSRYPVLDLFLGKFPSRKLKKIGMLSLLFLVHFPIHGQKLIFKDSTFLCDSIFVKYGDYLDEWGEVSTSTYDVAYFGTQVKVNVDIIIPKIRKKRIAIHKPNYEYFMIVYKNGNTSTLGIMTNGDINYNGLSNYRLNKALIKFLRRHCPHECIPKN